MILCLEVDGDELKERRSHSWRLVELSSEAGYVTCGMIVGQEAGNSIKACKSLLVSLQLSQNKLTSA